MSLQHSKRRGASQENGTWLGIYLLQGQDVREGFAGAQLVWDMPATAITGYFVVAPRPSWWTRRGRRNGRSLRRRTH